MPKTAFYAEIRSALRSKKPIKSKHFQGAYYVDIVGVTGSIPVTPTIQSQ